MRLVKLPKNQLSSRSGVTSLIEQAKVKLREFCHNKVLEHKLAAKSFSFEFDFHDSRRAVAKSISRLSSMIKRAILKQFPFMENAAESLIEDNSSQGLRMKISMLPRRLDNASLTTPSWVGQQFNPAKRYVRYLNYLCRKYSVPVFIQASASMSMREEEARKFRALDAAAQRTPTNWPEANTQIEILLSLAVWHPVSPRGVIQPYLDDKTGEVKPEFILDHTNWATTNVKDRPSVLLMRPGLEKFMCIERIFLFIPQIVQVVKTLSRKTTYDYKAFSFRSEEQP